MTRLRPTIPALTSFQQRQCWAPRHSSKEEKDLLEQTRRFCARTIAVMMLGSQGKPSDKKEIMSDGGASHFIPAPAY
jgi:hypothetical protein